MQGINHNNGNQWDYSRTGYIIGEKRNEWVRNIPTWLLNCLPVILIKQETVQTFGASHTLWANIPATVDPELVKIQTLRSVREEKQYNGIHEALCLLGRIAYGETYITPVYRTSYQVNGQEIASTGENFRYANQDGYTGGEKSLRDTQGFNHQFGSSIMLVEEPRFIHNGIGPGSNTESYKSSDPNNPYNASLLDGDLTNLPEQVTFQQIDIRSRVGLVLDGSRAVKMAAVVGTIAAAALMAYYRA